MVGILQGVLQSRISRKVSFYSSIYCFFLIHNKNQNSSNDFAKWMKSSFPYLRPMKMYYL